MVGEFVKKFHAMVLEHYTLSETFLVELKNLHTSACLNLNYDIAKQKPKV